MKLTRLISLVAATVLLLSACGSDDDGSTGTSSLSNSSTTSEDAASATSPLVGVWRAGPVSQAEAEETLRRHGLEEWIEPFGPLTPFDRDTMLILDIGEEWDLYGESDGGPRVEIDHDASYAIDADEVTVTHSAGANTYRWVVEGDTLTLEWLSTTFPPYEGVPEEVFQRTLYTTSAFTRDS